MTLSMVVMVMILLKLDTEMISYMVEVEMIESVYYQEIIVKMQMKMMNFTVKKEMIH
jgi:hypothetical protein